MFKDYMYYDHYYFISIRFGQSTDIFFDNIVFYWFRLNCNILTNIDLPSYKTHFLHIVFKIINSLFVTIPIYYIIVFPIYVSVYQVERLFLTKFIYC